MTTDLDLGARCERHAGEAFLVRCADCEQANGDLAEERAAERHQRALQRNAALGIHPDQKNPPRTVRRFPYRR